MFSKEMMCRPSMIRGVIQSRKAVIQTKNRVTKEGDAASKKLAWYAQHKSLAGATTNIAYADGVVTQSGKGWETALGLGAPMSTTIVEQFEAMLEKHEVVQTAVHNPINCAESHMWMYLTSEGKTTKNVNMWVAKVSNKGKIKYNSPCPNCQQWVRLEFKALNPS